jgi:hypothetical protein
VGVVDCEPWDSSLFLLLDALLAPLWLVLGRLEDDTLVIVPNRPIFDVAGKLTV